MVWATVRSTDDCTIGQEQREWVGNRKFDKAECAGKWSKCTERSTCGLLAHYNGAKIDWGSHEVFQNEVKDDRLHTASSGRVCV